MSWPGGNIWEAGCGKVWDTAEVPTAVLEDLKEYAVNASKAEGWDPRLAGFDFFKKPTGEIAVKILYGKDYISWEHVLFYDSHGVRTNSIRRKRGGTTCRIYYGGAFMKRTARIISTGLAAALCAQNALSHDQSVHMQITRSALNDANIPGSGLSAFSAVSGLEVAFQSLTDFMLTGSYEEDDNYDPTGGHRTFNHFYDPLTRHGLSNIPIDDGMQVGVDSFTWGSEFSCPGYNFVGVLWCIARNMNTCNQWSWQNARAHEWAGLMEPLRSDRESEMEAAFRAVGQVAHLLEDTSQPQHVRNEQHLEQLCPSELEQYGKDHYLTLNYSANMLDWFGCGFTKLEDFWNRRLYNGTTSAPLVADAANNNPQYAQRLGLAEFANGNFLGESHSFKEYSKSGAIDYYPFPSRDSSTDFQQVKANPALGIEPVTLANGHTGNGLYVKKVADGIQVQHLARIKFLAAEGLAATGKAATTIYDSHVEKDYHDILIPKAVSYAAGLIDYFFRGKISATLTSWDEETYSFSVKNCSLQNMSGTGFHLYYDDSGGNRTEITQETDPTFSLDYSGTLNPNATINGTFTPPTDAVRCIVVYQGTFGCSGPNALDPIDACLAIAACVVATPFLEATLPTATIGTSYTGQITSTGVSSPSYEITGGFLPEGLSMDSSGNITGTPEDRSRILPVHRDCDGRGNPADFQQAVPARPARSVRLRG